MRHFKRVLVLAATATLLFAGNAMSQENSNFLILPTSDIKLNTGQIAAIGDGEDWQAAIRAYTDTSDHALNAWCRDISPTSSAIAVSGKTLDEANLASCPSADGSYAMAITVPKEYIPETYGNMSGLNGNYLYLYLRSQNSESYEEFSPIGQRLLFPLYGDQASDLFSIAGDTDKGTFFPNFCQMCGCCVIVQE